MLNEQKQKISEEVNKEFFYSIPIDEMGSNQIGEQELLDFIFSKLDQHDFELIERIENKIDCYKPAYEEMDRGVIEGLTQAKYIIKGNNE